MGVPEGYSNEEIARFFGTTISAVDHKKRRLGLTRLRKASLPTRDELSAVWQADPRAEIESRAVRSYSMSSANIAAVAVSIAAVPAPVQYGRAQTKKLEKPML